MQIPKNSVRKRILTIARQEFLNNGFKDTSMRTIAKKANVSLSNIYNYFESKDEILSNILRPLLLTFEQLTHTHNSPQRLTTEWFTIESYQEKMLCDFMEIINNHRPELKLLLFGTSGSTFEHYTDTLIDQHTTMAIEYFKLMKEKYPSINDNISPFFIHTASSWWLTIVSEIVSHDELTQEEIKHFIENYITFGTAGWKSVMKI